MDVDNIGYIPEEIRTHILAMRAKDIVDKKKKRLFQRRNCPSLTKFDDDGEFIGNCGNDIPDLKARMKCVVLKNLDKSHNETLLVDVANFSSVTREAIESWTELSKCLVRVRVLKIYIDGFSLYDAYKPDKTEYKPLISKEEFLSMLPTYLINYIKLYPGLEEIHVLYGYKDMDLTFYNKVEKIVMHRVKAIGFTNVIPVEIKTLVGLNEYHHAQKLPQKPMWP
tara:strand:+ start:1122 stop:1793 length:672 start_codon:yes stop_codon:yes gene_type:complete